MNRIALVDGDILVYKAAFSTEYTKYSVEDKVFRYHREVMSYLRLNYDEDETPDVEKIPVLAPVKVAYEIIDSLISRINSDTEATKTRVFLSEGKSHRYKVDYPVPYKGNRTQPKPKHFKLIRQYLRNRYNAEYLDGYEADDLIGIAQLQYIHSGDISIVCSIDKDLDMIPGLHYNLDSHKMYEVDFTESWKNFYRQMIVGDKADNIIGLKGLGKKRAEKIIDEYGGDIITLHNHVRKLYDECFGEQGAEMFWANYQLLRILTHV